MISLSGRARLLFFIAGIIVSTAISAQPKKGALSEKEREQFDISFFAGMREKLIFNYHESEDAFRQALRIDPKNANVHFQLATVLLPQKRQGEAAMEAETAIKLDPSNEWYSKFLLDLYRRQQQYAEAVKVCETIFNKTGELNFLYEEASLLLLMHDGRKAINVYDRIEKKQGIREDISRQKEQLYLALRKPKKALDEIKKLSGAFPDDLSYKGMLADLYLVNGKEKEAQEIYNNMLGVDPKNGYAAFSLSEYYKIKNDEKHYFEFLERGMLSNADPKIKKDVLSKLIPTGDFGSAHKEKCRQLVDDFIRANTDDATPYLFKGDMYVLDASFEEARNAYKQSLARNESALVTWQQVLFCDEQMQRFDLMKEDCNRLIEVFPEYPAAWLYHSLASKRLKDYETALSSSRRGLELVDDNIEMMVQMLNNMGDIAHYAGKHALSDSAYDVALKFDPSNSGVLNNYAYFLSLRKVNLDKADSMSLKSITLDPDNASNLDTYGWIMFEKHDYEKARQYIEKSLKLSPDNAEVVEHLGDIMFMLKRNEEAVELWQKAKTLGGSGSELDRKIKDRKLQ